VKEIDDTPVPESESDVEEIVTTLWSWIAKLEERVMELETEVADLHHRRRVSRQQAVDQDPEWH